MHSPFPVAFDVGPLAGARTGVATAVDGMRRSLEAGGRVVTLPYQVSWRARHRQGVRTLPVPAAFAHRWWARSSRPRVDRWWPDARVIHGTNYVVPPSRLPRVVSVYDTWFLRHPTQATPDVARAGRILRRSIAEGAVVHAPSRATADSVRELFPSARIAEILLGAPEIAAPPPTCALAARLTSPFVVAIGTVERRKNLPTLVRAFAGLAAAVDDVTLVIAGRPGDDQVTLDAALDALAPAVRDRVVIAGGVDEATKSWLLHHAAALAYPSLDEGFGFPLLEAMRAGTAIVAARRGSIPEVVGDAALMCDADDADALAEALTRALDGSTNAALVAAGSHRWPMFDWGECAEQLGSLYIRLVETGS